MSTQTTDAPRKPARPLRTATAGALGAASAAGGRAAASFDRPRRMRAREEEVIPVFLLRLMGALVACALLIVAYATITDRPLEAMPAMEGELPVLAERALFIDADGSTGAARVLGGDGTLLADLGPEEGGFVAGIHRVLVRERTRAGLDMSQPVRLILFEGGQLSLRDPATGWRAELIGFGGDNAAVFMELLRK
jgi:putative photosynthetic complex assembly protein